MMMMNMMITIKIAITLTIFNLGSPDNLQIIKCLTFSESQAREDLNDDDEDENVKLKPSFSFYVDLLPCKIWTS